MRVSSDKDSVGVDQQALATLRTQFEAKTAALEEAPRNRCRAGSAQRLKTAEQQGREAIEEDRRALGSERAKLESLKTEQAETHSKLTQERDHLAALGRQLDEAAERASAQQAALEADRRQFQSERSAPKPTARPR